MPLLSILLLLAGFILLILGADKLVEGASSLAKRYKIPEIVIGLTIVAFGTSAPELAINIVAAINGSTDIVLGNVLGSNIFNVLLILGVAAMINPLNVKKNTVKYEIPFSVVAAILLLLLTMDTWFGLGENQLESRDGIILLVFFGFFLYYNFLLVKSNPDEMEVHTKNLPLWKSLVFMALGLAGLILGGRLIVDNAVKIAEILGISQRVIALTIVSIGTSLPELATSVMAVRRKEADIAIGNVVGSNIFNIFLVLGSSISIKNTWISDASLTDIWVNIGVGLLLIVFVFRGGDKTAGKWQGLTLDFWEGLAFVILYAGYLTYLVIQN